MAHASPLSICQNWVAFSFPVNFKNHQKGPHPNFCPTNRLALGPSCPCLVLFLRIFCQPELRFLGAAATRRGRRPHQLQHPFGGLEMSVANQPVESREGPKEFQAVPSRNTSACPTLLSRLCYPGFEIQLPSGILPHCLGMVLSGFRLPWALACKSNI